MEEANFYLPTEHVDKSDKHEAVFNIPSQDGYYKINWVKSIIDEYSFEVVINVAKVTIFREKTYERDYDLTMIWYPQTNEYEYVKSDTEKFTDHLPRVAFRNPPTKIIGCKTKACK